MKMSEIAEKLCDYDTRNPYGVKSYMTEEEIKEEGYTATSKHDCSCDNCFYGRTKLAEYIIKLKGQLNSTTSISVSGAVGWVCNSCNSLEYTLSVSEYDIQQLGCGNCGGDEFHVGNGR